MTQQTRLWELSEEIQELEKAIALVLENESLSEEDKENTVQQAFNQWLEADLTFKTKAEQVAAYIRHQEALYQITLDLL
jgi:predicted nucleotide-binding protein (sugar kinase/HSP70/actin superfamily)